MKSLLLIASLSLLLASCAYQDLKAPCTTLAATDAIDVPCNSPEPITALAYNRTDHD